MNNWYADWQSRNFVDRVVYSAKDNMFSLKKGNKIFSCSFRGEDVLIEEFEKRAFLLQGIGKYWGIRTLAKLISSGNHVVAPAICSLFKEIKFPKVLSRVTLYPIGSSLGNIIYEDFNGERYIHSGAEGKVSLLFYKALYDRNREMDYLSLPELLPNESSLQDEEIQSSVSDKTALEALSSLYNIPDFKKQIGHGVPPRLNLVKSNAAFQREVQLRGFLWDQVLSGKSAIVENKQIKDRITTVKLDSLKGLSCISFDEVEVFNFK